MKMPSMEKVRGVIGLLMVSTFVIILCFIANPMPLDEFAINMAKALGMLALLGGGIILVIKR